MGTKANPGQYDCYEKAESDEPMFILLARDPVAPLLVRIWTELRYLAGKKDDWDMTQEAMSAAREMEAWRKEHRPQIDAGRPSGEAGRS